MAFLSFRSDEALSGWVRGQAKKRGLSSSDIMREALLQYKERRDAAEEACLGVGLETLKEEVGGVFRVEKADGGLLLKKVKPGVVELK